MEKFPVNQQELYEKMGVQKWLCDWKKTSKSINLRNSILDNLSFTNLRFVHDADFSGSSLVNATFRGCYFSNDCNYLFDGCDLQNCRFIDSKVVKSEDSEYPNTFLDMIKSCNITFSGVKNLDQAKFDNLMLKNDKRIKSTIRQTFYCCN